jgi:hypothetical protein
MPEMLKTRHDEIEIAPVQQIELAKRNVPVPRT